MTKRNGELAALTERFRALGAKNPVDWASSQIGEGIPQLHRYLFLRQAWRAIVSDDDHAWIDANIAATKRDPNAPYAGVGHALAAMREKGVDDEDIAQLVRGMQAELLFSFCYLLEDPNFEDADAMGVSWSLVALDEQGEPTGPIPGLHESVLELDPTGRDMRPKRRP
ncbi:MAG: hypothetical protein QM778_30405 [Myxococcales bacterium]